MSIFSLPVFDTTLLLPFNSHPSIITIKFVSNESKYIFYVTRKDTSPFSRQTSVNTMRKCKQSNPIMRQGWRETFQMKWRTFLAYSIFCKFFNSDDFLKVSQATVEINFSLKKFLRAFDNY